MDPSDRCRDLIDYLSFLGARFDVDVPARRWWRFGSRAHDGSEQGRVHVMDVVARVVRTSPDDDHVLVVVPAGRIPTEGELQSAIGRFQWIDPDELMIVSAGVAPETLPPFGWPYMPGIAKVFLDREIVSADLVAFKAASADHTLFMTAREFQGVLGNFELLSPCS